MRELDVQIDHFMLECETKDWAKEQWVVVRGQLDYLMNF